MNVGTRIKQLRLSQGYSLDEMVCEIDGIVSKQALSKYERGICQPSTKVLNHISFKFGVKTSYFFESSSLKFHFIGFRKKTNLRIRQQEQIQYHIKQILEERVRLQKLCGTNSPLRFPIHKYSASSLTDIEEAALKLRKEWDMGLAPIASVVEMLEDHHVHVVELDSSKDFDGQSVTIHEDNKLVAVGVITRFLDSGEHQRLNLIHELGHLVLKSENDNKINEKNAQRFAEAFLVPGKTLKQSIGNKRKFINLEEMILLKKRFGISMQALIYRIKDVGIINESHFREWIKTFHKMNWHDKEPNTLEREIPQWQKRVTFQGLAEGWLSDEEAEKMLGEKILSKNENSTLKKRKAFMRIPIEHRRKILEEQAQGLATHYIEEDIGSGDIIEY